MIKRRDDQDGVPVGVEIHAVLEQYLRKAAISGLMPFKGAIGSLVWRSLHQLDDAEQANRAHLAHGGMLLAQVGQHAVQHRPHLGGVLHQVVFLHHLDVGDGRCQRDGVGVVGQPALDRPAR